MLETLRDRVGTPELVPKNVISTFNSGFAVSPLNTLQERTLFNLNTKSMFAVFGKTTFYAENRSPR